MERRCAIELNNFTGGLQLPLEFGAEIPPNALLQADNVEFTPAGHIRGRRGRSLYATLPNRVTALWRHYPRSGSPATLAAVDSGATTAFFHDTASNGSFTAVTGGAGFATGKKFYFTNWGSKDRSFMANGDVLLSYNGVITTVVQTGGQITGPYLVIHQSRLFGTKLSEINYSVYATDVNDELTINAASQLNVSDPQGGSITGLASLPDRLLIFKSTNIWTLLGDIRFSAILTKLTETGCIAPASVAQAPYGVFFVGRSGVYLTDGQAPEPVKVSMPIDSLFTSIGTNVSYPNAVGVYYPRRDMYKLKLDPSHNYTYTLQRVMTLVRRHLLAQWAWSKNTNEPMVAGHVWDSESDTGDPYVSDTTGHIYHADSGTTDAGTAYTSIVQTASLRLHPQQYVGRIHFVQCNYTGTGPATMSLRYNNAATDDVVTTVQMGVTGSLGLQRGSQRIVDQTKSGQFVSAVVTLPQDGPNTELYSIGLDARLRSARVWR